MITRKSDGCNLGPMPICYMGITWCFMGFLTEGVGNVVFFVFDCFGALFLLLCCLIQFYFDGSHLVLLKLDMSCMLDICG